jgi:hypothetical protein
MAIRQPRYSKEEAARRGDEIYEQDVRPKVGAQDHGKYVAIDIETRQWEMDEDEMVAGDHLRGRIPDAQIWMTRVGYGYTRRFGAAFGRRPI